MKKYILTSLLILAFPSTLLASELNSGDIAWVSTSTILVMLMTPAGLALFYGGLTRNKSVLNTVAMSYLGYCVATLAWVVLGYSLAFSGDGQWIGNLDNFMLGSIDINEVSGSIPTLLFVAFQGTFAAIAVAIVSGSVIERIKFSTWLVFTFFWVLVVYSPVAHWVWGGGFLSQNGELDFAGGTVVHINAGIAGLVLLCVLGKRKDYISERSQPVSIKFTALGAALLWFGWFGFNSGSELAADAISVNALLVTNVSTAAAALTWILIEWKDTGKPTLLGAVSGTVAGLVAITPAAGFVDVSGSLIMGVLGGFVGYFFVVKLKQLIRYDDTLDAFGLHGMVGVLGALATGVFASPAINGAAGALYGNPGQVLTQLFAVLCTIAYSAVATYLVYKLAALLTGGGRVSEQQEDMGMDEALHGERAFEFEE